MQDFNVFNIIIILSIIKNNNHSWKDSIIFWRYYWAMNLLNNLFHLNMRSKGTKPKVRIKNKGSPSVAIGVKVVFQIRWPSYSWKKSLVYFFYIVNVLKTTEEIHMNSKWSTLIWEIMVFISIWVLIIPNPYITDLSKCLRSNLYRYVRCLTMLDP